MIAVFLWACLCTHVHVCLGTNSDHDRPMRRQTATHMHRCAVHCCQTDSQKHSEIYLEAVHKITGIVGSKTKCCS